MRKEKKPGKVPRKKSAHARGEELTAYAFIAPQYIGMLCFVLIPVVISLILCFTEWDMLSEMEFVGLKNFVTIFSKPRLRQALSNTLLFALGVIPITICVSLGLALMVNEKLRGLNIYKAYYDASVECGKPGDLMVGANIAGFLKVAEAMMAQGVV